MNTNLGVEWRAHLILKLPLKSNSCHTWISLVSGAQFFFYFRRNNYRPKKFACWPPLYSDAFENIDEARTPYLVMIAETISSACFVLLVVVFCCMIKIYTMVKNIRPSLDERVRGVCTRDNERALPVEREPTVYFPRAERGAGQHGTCNNTIYSGSQAIRRQPQMHDERFGWQSKQKMSRMFQYNSKIIFFLSLLPSTIQAVNYHLLSLLTWCDTMFTIFTEVFVSNSLQAIEEYWTRNEFPS